MRNEKNIIAAITSIACLITALSACNRVDSHAGQHQPRGSATVSKIRVPAHFTEAPPLASLGPTLSPGQFTGKVRQAYQAAKDIPQTIAQLPCFCNCDRSTGHKSLYSCYEDEHAVGCGICLDSALMAAELKQQGMGDVEIRAKLIDKYNALLSN